MDIQMAIDTLRCAEFNCDNAKKVGLVMVDLVKAQIQTAIKCLENDEEEAPHGEQDTPRETVGRHERPD